MMLALALAAALAASGPADAAGNPVIVRRNIEYGTGGGVPLHMDISYPAVKPDSRMPVVVWVHGGGWRWGSRDSNIRNMVEYSEDGYFCATVSYRFAPAHVFPAQIHDVKCAVRYLRAHADGYGIDPDRFGAVGYSAGGHLVALLGTSAGVAELEGDGGWAEHSSRVQAVCDWYGSHDFVVMERDPKYGIGRGVEPGDNITILMGGPLSENLDKARLATPASFISKDDPPFLLVHGDEDPLVPYALSPLLLENLRKGGVEAELVTVQGGKHGGNEFQNAGLEEKQRTFFDRHLKQ